MKILFIIPYFYPAISFGGPVKVTYDLVKELSKRGHEVVVYTSDAKDQKNRLDSIPKKVGGVKVYYFKNLSMLFVKKSNLFLTLGLPRQMKEQIKTFDLIHAHEYSTYQNIVLKRYSKKFGVPYVIQAHGSLLGSDRKLRKKVFDRFFGNGILANASKVIALNHSEEEEYRIAGVPPGKIALVPNGLNISDFEKLQPTSSFKAKYSIPTNCRLILYLGRIHKTKGIDLLVKAFSYLLETMHCQNLLLVIAGPDDGYLTQVKSLVDSLGLANNVLFTGLISDREKVSALHEAEVLVTPSFSGMPMTFLESCATGTPIITTTLGDRLDWLNGNIGFVTSSNVEDLASSIFRVMYDPSLRAKFSEKCLQTVNSLFSIEKIASQLEIIYRSALQEKGK